MMCLREDDCQSWNFYETLTGLKCELNNATSVLEDSLLEKEGAKFGHRFDDLGKVID